MDAGAAMVARLRANGLSVALSEAGRIQVRPRERVTQEMDRWIRAQREAMVLALKAERTEPAVPPQAVEPFHKVPNAIWDRLAEEHDLDSYALLTLLFLCRKIIGWHREASGDLVSLNQAARAMRCSRSTVVRSLARLEACGLIRRERSYRERDGETGAGTTKMPDITRIWLTLPRE